MRGGLAREPVGTRTVSSWEEAEVIATGAGKTPHPIWYSAGRGGHGAGTAAEHGTALHLPAVLLRQRRKQGKQEPLLARALSSASGAG